MASSPSSVGCKIFPGRLHSGNQGAVAWGSQNLVAYGSHSYVVVVDPVTLHAVQTLDEHRAAVCALQWSPEGLQQHPSTTAKPYKLRLASGDMIGNIIVWLVLEASLAVSLIQEGVRQVLDLQWHPSNLSFLVALNASASAPASSSSAGVLTLWNIAVGSKLWRVDFSEPVVSLAFNPFDPLHLGLSTSSGAIFFVWDFKLDTKPSLVEHKYTISSSRSRGNAKALATNDFKQMAYSPHSRNIMYFLLSREIMVFDLSIHQSIGSVVLERNRPSFTRMILCRDNQNIIYTLHDDGSLALWSKKSDEFRFELKCLSDPVRFGKHTKKKGLSVFGVASGPLVDDRIASVTNDGTIWMWECKSAPVPRFTITGLVETLSSPVSTLCVSHFTPEKESLVAVGTYHGTIQIIDMLRSVTKLECMMWSHAVRGLKWLSATLVIAFSCEEIGKAEFKNRISVLNLNTGQQREIRKMNSPESTFIRGLRVSSAGQYFIVMLKDRPFELWELKDFTLLRTMKPYVQITALEWSPMKPELSHELKERKSLAEQFVFTLPDGTLKSYIVENNAISASEINADLGVGIISCLAWKGDMLVSGDTTGTIHCWNIRTRKALVFATNKGLIRRLRFSPSQKSHHIMALFSEGDVGIWDLDNNIRISISSYLKARDLKAIDCDWISENTPVVSTSDGCIRVMDRSLSISNSPLVYSTLQMPLFTPHLLPALQALQLKVLLQHYVGETLSYEMETSPRNAMGDRDQQQRSTSDSALLDCVDYQLLKQLETSSGLAERCLITAQFYGHQEEINFWRLVLWALKKYPQHERKTPKDSNFNSPILGDEESTEKESKDGIEHRRNTESPGVASQSTSSVESTLPAYFDLLLEKETIQSKEQERARIHESRKSGPELTQKLTEFNILLGKKEKAIELLLETGHSGGDSATFYQDALKAAVVAASVSPESFQNTMKLIATNMIANNNVDEGVQLLCLIGKNLDACRYLQSYDRWTDAAWLAKISLPEAEGATVMLRWAQHLQNTSEKMKAILILLTLGEFPKVLKLLHESQYSELAALFAISSGLPSEKSTLSKSLEISQKKEFASPETSRKSDFPLEQVLQSIYLDYGFFLQHLDNLRAAEFYWGKAGKAGDNAIENSTKDRKGFLRKTQ